LLELWYNIDMANLGFPIPLDDCHLENNCGGKYTIYFFNKLYWILPFTNSNKMYCIKDLPPNCYIFFDDRKDVVDE
jgi:hypothetical protein